MSVTILCTLLLLVLRLRPRLLLGILTYLPGKTEDITEERSMPVDVLWVLLLCVVGLCRAPTIKYTPSKNTTLPVRLWSAGQDYE